MRGPQTKEAHNFKTENDDVDDDDQRWGQRGRLTRLHPSSVQRARLVAVADDDDDDEG